MKKMIRGVLVFAVFASLSSNQLLAQQRIQIQVQNLQPNSGFFLTPVWFGLHDGSFDYFDEGSAASMSVENLAEEGMLDDGMGGGLINDFASMSPTGTQGVAIGPEGFGSMMGQPPVLDPGESYSFELQFDDPLMNRFLSYGSMVIPSNDAFIGNDSGTQYELFDALGNFNGTQTIQIFGNQIWDAGTEANDGLGAAFSANGGDSTDESLLIRAHPGLDNFVGTETAAGTTIGSGIGPGEPVAIFTITAIPEPNGNLAIIFVLALCFGGSLLARRRLPLDGRSQAAV